MAASVRSMSWKMIHFRASVDSYLQSLRGNPVARLRWADRRVAEAAARDLRQSMAVPNHDGLDPFAPLRDKRLRI